MTSQHRAVRVKNQQEANRLQANVARAAQPELDLPEAVPFRTALQALLAPVAGAYVGALELSDRGGRSCTVIYSAPVPHASIAVAKAARAVCWAEVEAACSGHSPAWPARIEGHGEIGRAHV